MTANTPITGSFEELMSRDSNGIQVTLLWNRSSNDTLVAVYDTSTDTAFQLEVGSANPLDVFNHPYAYAAFHHIEVAPLVELDDVESLAA